MQNDNAENRTIDDPIRAAASDESPTEAASEDARKSAYRRKLDRGIQTITFDLPSDLYAAFRNKANDRGMSVANMLRRVMRVYARHDSVDGLPVPT